MFTIMTEFIESTERLSELHPALSIFGSARIKADNPLCMDIARRFPDEGFAVISGGSPGLMEAANKSTFEGKSPSVDMNIELPHEQSENKWQDISPSFHHFLPRKVAFVPYADAYIVLPSGFGTFDELTEVLTLIQTGKYRHIPIVLIGSNFWNGLLGWFRTQLVDDGIIAAKNMNLIQVLDILPRFSMQW